MSGNSNKWALLIGINVYPRLPSMFHLKGCINDVAAVGKVLKDNYGFPDNNVVTLTEQNATHDRILAEMNSLSERIRNNDIVVMYYAGHGSQIRDREGDEPDGWDETIVPYDSGRFQYDNKDITDDEIYKWLMQINKRTPFVSLLFDCCHSGTITRDVFGSGSRWAPSDERAIEDLPASPILLTNEEKNGLLTNTGPSGWLPLGDRYVLVAGCRDEESSYEYRGTQSGSAIYHGAMTYFLCQELAKVQNGTTYRDIIDRVNNQVSSIYPRQHPQMEGAADRELFGIRQIEPMRFVKVENRSANTVTLGAGAAHGLTVGSKWAVYSQEVRQVEKQTPNLGKVEVIKVYAIASEARVFEGGEKIIPSCRAIEEEHSFGEMRLRVEIVTPKDYRDQQEELEELLEASPMLRISKNSEETDFRTYLVPPRDTIKPGDPVPQLGVIANPIWVVVGQDGKLAMPVHTINEVGVANTLRDNFEKLARYRHTLALKNPDDRSRLKGKVRMVLKRQKADGTWEDARPQDAGGQILFFAGDRIAAEINNLHNSPVYVSILDFGLTGRISQLYPVVGASEQLRPGGSIQIGTREGSDIILFIPKEFPYAMDPTDPEPVGGIETFKVFATTMPGMDLRLHLQAGLRGNIPEVDRSDENSPLIQQLFKRAYTGEGTRDTMQYDQISPEEDWTTTDYTIFLQRRD
jgi:Caspase domain